MKELNNFDSQLLYYCKGHFRNEKVGFFIGLKRIWAVRCGITEADNSSYATIADRLYKMLVYLEPEKISYFHEVLHRDINKIWYEEFTPLERLILIYRSALFEVAVRNNRRFILKLVKPNKRVMKRIVAGKGRFDDYKLLN